MENVVISLLFHTWSQPVVYLLTPKTGMLARSQYNTTIHYRRTVARLTLFPSSQHQAKTAIKVLLFLCTLIVCRTHPFSAVKNEGRLVARRGLLQARRGPASRPGDQRVAQIPKFHRDRERFSYRDLFRSRPDVIQRDRRPCQPAHFNDDNW